MSHFYVWVFLPKGTSASAVEPMVKALLAPYSENLDVPEYDRRCYCVGSAARQDARKTAASVLGSIEAFRASFAVIQKERGLADEDAIQAAWEAHIKPLQDREKAAFAAHPDHAAARADCDECHGTGTYKSTSNPRGHWDWYRIGGRWDGEITGSRASSENGFNFGKEHERPSKNIAATRDLRARLADDVKFTPYAAVTPDGEWHSRGRMGWWGMSSGDNPREEWRAEVIAMLDAHDGCLVVGCDLHV